MRLEKLNAPVRRVEFLSLHKVFLAMGYLYPMRLQKKNAPIRRVLFSSLHKVFHQFSCALRACKIVKTVKILLAGHVFILCDYKKRTLLFVASFFLRCIRFFINFPAHFVLAKLWKPQNIASNICALLFANRKAQRSYSSRRSFLPA